MKGREMRDNRYTNMWGETPEEQEKRREWLRGVYDRATTPEQTQQSTPMPSQSEQMALQDNANINYNQPAATQNHSGESDPSWLDKAGYAANGAMQGLSFGFADEIEGAMGGLGYGLASLNSD